MRLLKKSGAGIYYETRCVLRLCTAHDTCLLVVQGASHGLLSVAVPILLVFLQTVARHILLFVLDLLDNAVVHGELNGVGSGPGTQVVHARLQTLDVCTQSKDIKQQTSLFADEGHTTVLHL